MIIEEQLISFETAKLLKEKGFKEYRNNKSYSSKGKISDWEHYYDYNGKPETLGVYQDHIAAISQTFVQKWLREKHNIHIQIHHFTNQPMNGEMWENCYQLFLNDEGKHPYYRTYEETLELGLFEALNLI